MLAMLGFGLMAGEAHAAEGRHAIVLKINGSAQVRINQGEWKAAEAGMVLHEKDEIKTARKSTVKILLDDGGSTGQLELKPESRLNLDTMPREPASGDKTTILDLAIGDVLVHAQKLQGQSQFKVRTPNATTGVRGTTFLVSTSPKK